MAAKKMLFVALLTLCIVLALTGVVCAEGNQTSTVDLSWFSWSLFFSYAAIGAFAGVIHDVNDGQGLIILPHKTAQNTWDLGIITPALFGAVAGFFALAAQNANVAFLEGLFPQVGGSGILAAFFAGYFYSKTIQVVLSKLPVLSAPTTTTPASSPPPASPPTPTAT